MVLVALRAGVSSLGTQWMEMWPTIGIFSCKYWNSADQICTSTFFSASQHVFIFGTNPQKSQNVSSKLSLNMAEFCKLFWNTSNIVLENLFTIMDESLLRLWGLNSAEVCTSCRFRQELSNEFQRVCTGTWKSQLRYRRRVQNLLMPTYLPPSRDINTALKIGNMRKNTLSNEANCPPTEAHTRSGRKPHFLL